MTFVQIASVATLSSINLSAPQQNSVTNPLNFPVGCAQPLPRTLLPRVCQPGWQCLAPVTLQELQEKGLNKGMNLYYDRIKTSRRIPYNMQGVGSVISPVIKVLTMLVPILLSLLVVFGTTLAPLDPFVHVHTAWVIWLLFGAMVCSTLAAKFLVISVLHPDMVEYECYTSQSLAAGYMSNVGMFILICLAMVCTSLCFRFAHIEFKFVSFRLHPFMFIIKVILAILATEFVYFLPQIFSTDLFFADRNLVLRSLIFLTARFALFGFLPPGLQMYGLFAYFKYRELFDFNCWINTAEDSCGFMANFLYPTNGIANIYTLLCCFAAYSRDRKFVALTGFAVSFAFRFGRVSVSGARKGAVKEDNWHMKYIFAVVLLLFAYFCALFARSQRVLTKELQKVKYVRIGYLRRMYQEGMMIKRCQEMPDEAFGNVTKATKLIILSHRWLHRYTCDVKTPEYPNGLRLTTMVEKLETFFPTTWKSFWTSKEGWFGAIYALLAGIFLGESDVLIFFDFISVPQLGQQPDGTIIQRTSGEQQIFEEALPAMGGLYTMYDVMVCPEVPEGVPDYESSGWCFCEWESAYLYRKLHKYSSDQLAKRLVKDEFDRHFDDSVATNFVSSFEEELKTKLFFFDKDRDTVRGIVRSKITCRMLIDAVDDQDVEKVRKLIKDLKDNNLLSAIDDPIDENTLDSLLHVAVRLPSKEIVDMLIEAGVKVDTRNFVGDTPYQRFMIPRCWHS